MANRFFQKRPVLKSDSEDEERNSLEMIYRHNVEFAVGHGISVHTKVEERDSKYALEIKTKVLPNYEVPMTETPGLMKEDRPALKEMISKGYLDMRKIASMNSKELRSVLETLTNDYKSWIQEQRNRIGKDLVGYDEVASDAMNKCEMIYNRLVEGINAIIPNPNDDEVTPALEAFRFANLAMASQRVRSIYALKKRRNENPNFHDLDIPKNRSWRPFQLAFILLSIPALVDPKHKDRTEPIESLADLLWFPTGGGKTEAYLGVAGFSMAIRRLQDDLGDFDSKRGLSVIMRYTLRLLTIQQFQRATTLICAMETMRRQDSGKWGEEPFTIGLWVGKRVTPNTTEEAHEAISDIRASRRQKASSPHQLSFCPWCGSEIKEGRDIEVKKIERDIGKTIIYCGDPKSECDFTKAKSKDFGLPISVVDEEIYRRPPSMLIATVDKFARIAWEGKTRTLFGYATTECP
ncbi:MAG: hypothetical protein M5T52_23610 [Ignavibacteriaceae bacterium]|nr:hypothetical protein [Ignavibacteriaceae bacterium]